MAVSNPKNSRGFAQIMPVFKKSKQGGVRIVKLLFDRGFETFPRTDQGFAPLSPVISSCPPRGWTKQCGWASESSMAGSEQQLRRL